MRRSLFDELRPKSQPRLRPNLFARTTQWAIQNGLTVVVSTLLFCALLAFPIFIARPQLASLEFAGQSQANGNWARLQRGFPGIEHLATLGLAHPDAAKLAGLRQDVVESLKARSDLFQLVLAPGAGDYYNTYGVYYHKTDELDARVSYALSLKTLFEAIAAAPRGDSLATLVNEVAAAIEQGRDPQGLDTLFTEASAAVSALMTGQERRVDWLKVAGLDLDDNAQAGLVLVWPRPGQAQAANEFLDTVVKGLKNDPKIGLSLQKAALDGGLAADKPPLYPPLGLAGMSALLALLVLQVLLGQMRLVLISLVPPLIAALMAASALAYTSPVLWPSFWPVIVAAAAIGLVLALRFIFAILDPLEQNRPVLTSSMLAAQKQGAGLVGLALAASLPWLAYLMLQDLRFLPSIVAMLLATMAALLATLVLQPVLLSLMGPRYHWAAAEWLQPIHDALFANGLWPVLRGLMMIAVLPLVALAMWFHPPLAELSAVNDRSNAPVNILANSPEAGEEIIAKLKSVPQAGAIRWLGAFLPDDVEAKQLLLAKLADVFPKIPPQQPSELDDLQQQMDTLRESLSNIAAAEHARPALKAAADEFRRSLELFANTGTDRELLSFENRLFGGFNRLAATAEAFAALKPPELSDLDPGLKSMFQAGSGELRIEVTPVRGTSSLSLARILDERGFPVAHPLLDGVNNQDLFRHNLDIWMVPSLVLFAAGVLLGARHWRKILTGAPVATIGLGGLAACYLQLEPAARPETLLLASSGLTFLLLALSVNYPRTPVTSQPALPAQDLTEAFALVLLIAALSAPILILRIEPWLTPAWLLLALSATAAAVVSLLLQPLLKAMGD